MPGYAGVPGPPTGGGQPGTWQPSAQPAGYPQDSTTQGYPGGSGYPAGQGYPGGPGYAAGPGYPGEPGGPGGALGAQGRPEVPAGPARSRGKVVAVVVGALVLAAAAVLVWFLFFRGPTTPEPLDAAETLAAALESGDVSAVPLHTTTSVVPQEQYAAVFEQLAAAVGDRGHTVSVADLEEVAEGADAGKRATATLQWTWPVTSETAWEYSTRVDLAYAEPAEGEDTGEWVATWDPTVLVPDLKAGERLSVDRTLPRRGEILGAGGAQIVTARTVHRVGIDKFNLPADQWDSSARALATLMHDLDPDEFVAAVRNAGDKAYVEAYVVREGDSTHDLGAIRSVPGVLVREDTLNLAPTPDFARAVLGRSGEATAEIIEKSEGKIQQGDQVGLSGLQLQYDEQLRGLPGISVMVQPAEGAEEGAEPRQVFAVEPVDGTSVQTTLDVDVQARAESVLAGVVPASALVAIRPSTGEVVAAANGPGNEHQNFALLGQYPPGSTFKIATTLGMLRSGMTPSSIVSCPPEIAVDGRAFQNVPGYPTSALGEIPLATAFANSCNTAMIGQRETVSQQTLHDSAAALGLGVESPLGTGGFFGSVPTEAGATTHAASMIGQGEILASPLGMATVAASVGAGHRVAPVLVPSDEAAAPAPGGVTAEEAAALRDLMAGVVREGSAQVLQGVPGIVGAKTGTAEHGDNSGPPHVWMVAIAGDLAVAVFVAEGEFGSTTAGPIMRAFLGG